MESIIDVNYFGKENVLLACFKYLKESKGQLLHFTSNSYTRGRGFYSSYSSSKAAIVNFVQALSDELYRYGIRANIICPERTDTPMRWSNFERNLKKLFYLLKLLHISL